MDPGGYLYVADANNDRIQKFTLDGEYVTAWGSEGLGEGQFRRPRGIAIDQDGYVYVADFWGHSIQKFTSGGAFVAAWGSSGTGDGQFAQPAGIAIDRDGYLYVADSYNHRVQKFTADGEFEPIAEVHDGSIQVQQCLLLSRAFWVEGAEARTKCLQAVG